ncbi:MAG: hypothetical protein Q9162_001165 [Coniocarpon cinnabarinum]
MRGCYAEDELLPPPRSGTARDADTKKDALTALSRSRCSPPDEIFPGSIKPQDPASIPDTELAQHYLTHTVEHVAQHSICGEPPDTWRVLVPSLALKYLAVRRGMLTLAAICMHYDSVAADPSANSWKYLEAAEAQGVIFVAESSKVMRNLDAVESEQVFACSRLLCVLGFAFFRAHRRNGITLVDRAGWTWLQLLRGAKSTYIAEIEANQDLDETSVKDTFAESPSAQDPPVPLVVCAKSAFEHHALGFVRRSQQTRFDALRTTLCGNWTSLGDRKLQDLGAAVDILYEVTGHVCSQSGHNLLHTICRWPSKAPKGFTDMLIDAFPPALAVYAHWLMLVVLLEHVWFIDDMGRAGIRNVIDVCSDADPDVRALLIWPRLMLDEMNHSTKHSYFSD